MIPTGTTATLKPGVVEYRRPSGYGVQVVVITLLGDDPRVLAKAEIWRTCSDEQPMSLTLSEIHSYVTDARLRLGQKE